MKKKCVRQHDFRDCGAACLATICSRFGIVHSLAYYRDVTKTDSDGVNIYGIVEAFKMHGFRSEAFQTELSELTADDNLEFPFIARVVNDDNQYHFVVVDKIAKNKVYISDPAKGNKIYTLMQFEEIFVGQIITCIPENVVKEKEASITRNTIKYLLRKNIFLVIIAVVFATVISLAGVLSSLIIQYEFEMLENEESFVAQFDSVDLDELYELHEKGDLTEEEYIDNYMIGANVLWLHDNFDRVLLLLLVTIIVQNVIGLLRQKVLVKLSVRFNEHLLNSLSERIMSMKYSHLDYWKTGELLTRCSDVSLVSDSFITTIMSLIIDTVMVFIGGYLLFKQNYFLFLIVCVLIFLYVLIIRLFIKPLMHVNYKTMEASTNQYSSYKEMIDNIKEIKAYGSEQYIIEKVRIKVGLALKWYKKSTNMGYYQNQMVSLASGISNILLLAFSFFMITNGEMNIATYIGFMAMMDFFIDPVENLVDLQNTIQSGLISLNRLSDVLDDIGNEENSKSDLLFKCEKEIRVDNITFRYGNKPAILKSFSLHIPIAKTTLIVGDNGCGKSTLAKLIARQYYCEEGEIYYDNTNIVEIDNNDFVKNVLYLTQEVGIFSGTIKDNICMGLNAIDDEIYKVCQIAGIYDFIQQMPLKLKENLGENGKNISTGQKQRIGIARALLRNPKVLILDEALSNIDVQGKKQILENIKNRIPNLTLIIINHGLECLELVDSVIDLATI